MSMQQLAKNVAAACLLGLLVACAGNPPGRTPATEFSATGVGPTVVRAALSQIGQPYRYGGQSPAGFDCSGLVVFAYQSAGLNLPRSSMAQYRQARPVDVAQAQPGDLLFFQYNGRISHVGIYLGEQQFVHAPSSGGVVSQRSIMEPHYRERLVAAGRFAVSH